MRHFARSLLLAAASLAFVGWDCGSGADDGPAPNPPPQGPPGSILDFDAEAIPPADARPTVDASGGGASTTVGAGGSAGASIVGAGGSAGVSTVGAGGSAGPSTVGAGGFGGSSAGRGGGGAGGGTAGAGGSVIGEPRCAGVAQGCTLLGASQCSLTLGCMSAPRCEGISTSCYSQFSSYSCISQQGCFWSSSTMKCSGSAWGCDLMRGSLSCIDQQGCFWRDHCAGSSTPCSLLTATECTRQPGCRLETP